MSEKKKNALFYSREDLTGRGSSKIQLFELENPGEVNKINIDGKLVILNPVSVQGTNIIVKPYVFIESYRNMDLTTVDVIYGNLNINELRKNEPLRKRLFDENLTRENLEIITRKYCGLIPYRVFNDPYGKKDFQMPKDKAPFLAKAIMGSAYVENRQTSINMNNARSSNSNGNRGSFWSRLFGTKTEAESNTSLGQYTSTTTYTKNEGVLFYKSGAVIFNKKLYSKFNYATKDSETGVRTQVDSILIGEVNEERLKRDEEYRKAFVTEIFSPSRLKNARTVSGFPYIGNFTESKRFEYDMDAIKDFNELVQYGNR